MSVMRFIIVVGILFYLDDNFNEDVNIYGWRNKCFQIYIGMGMILYVR